jgi:molecular chaperone GrpE
MPHNKNHDKGSHKDDQGSQPLPEEKFVTITKEEYEVLKAKSGECDAFNDKYIRAQAEFENVRKRLEKDKMDFVKYANEGFVLDLLPIIDNLEMAEKHIKEAKDFKAVQDGVDMIQLQIQGFLKDIGLERIKAAGEKFDPHLHEPIETVEAPDKEDGIIVDEMKPGYKLNGKLLRPASVKIVKNK